MRLCRIEGCRCCEMQWSLWLILNLAACFEYPETRRFRIGLVLVLWRAEREKERETIGHLYVYIGSSFFTVMSCFGFGGDPSKNGNLGEAMQVTRWHVVKEMWWKSYVHEFDIAMSCLDTRKCVLARCSCKASRNSWLIRCWKGQKQGIVPYSLEMKNTYPSYSVEWSLHIPINCPCISFFFWVRNQLPLYFYLYNMPIFFANLLIFVYFARKWIIFKIFSWKRSFEIISH